MHETPEHIGQSYGFNVVVYDQQYWGVPQSFGNVSLEHISISSYPGILSASNQDELDIKIFETWSKRNQLSEPMLFRQICGHNLVGYTGRFYAVPTGLGEIRLEAINIEDYAEIISSASLNTLYDKVIETDCKKRINQPPHLAESTDQHNIVYYQEQFIAIPKILGNVRLEIGNVAAYKGLKKSGSLIELKDAIVAAGSQKGPAAFLQRIMNHIVVDS